MLEEVGNLNRARGHMLLEVSCMCFDDDIDKFVNEESYEELKRMNKEKYSFVDIFGTIKRSTDLKNYHI